MKAVHFLSIALWMTACGGGAGAAPPAESPPPPPETAATDIPEAPPAAAHVEKATPAASSAATTSPPTPKVEFPPHASVDQAIKAVPQGAPRLNMANDLMQAPLLDLQRYDKCKVPRTTKVLMNVAVYDGVAVGVDVTTKPKNTKMEECLDGVVRSMTWEKVPSLNQVNVNF